MAHWISLATFKELYSKETDLLSSDSHTEFLRRLQSQEGDAIRISSGIDTGDFLRFTESIKAPEVIIFHGWVAQSGVLEKTLSEERVSGTYHDAQGSLNHTLANAFRRFITPYLAPILLKRIPDEMEPLSAYFSFVPLLDEDTRPTVEMQLFKPVREQLMALSDAQSIDKEQELIQLVQPLCSDAFINSMNLLSKGSYALKIEYVDRILEAIRTPACTVRFANWILKQMERLSLNNEHQDKLNELRRELATGNLRVKKLESAKTGIRLRPILITALVLLLLTAGIYLIVAKPFNKAKVHHAYDSASAEFTEEELAKIDSLAFEIDQESYMEGIEIDPNIIIQSVSTISLRQPFETDLMEQIFTDVNQDVTLKENYYTDSCGTVVDFIRYPGVKDLSSHTADKNIQFRNDSDYDLIVYVTDNEPYGSVYSMLVKSGATERFKMNEGDVLTTVAGNDFVAFIPPVGSFEEEKPSQNFRYHFCDTDYNYFESINTALVLGSTVRDDIKFLVRGTAGSAYELIDVYNVAETY